MEMLLVVIVSWNRPGLLRRTLESLFLQLHGCESHVCVVDNGSDEATRQVIRDEQRVGSALFLSENIGINGGVEAALRHCDVSRYRWLLISDADMEYRRPRTGILPLLDGDGRIGALSLQHSPEHAVTERIESCGQTLYLKKVERGCALLFATERFQVLRPLPVHKMLDFDWWVMRDAPQSLRSRRPRDCGPWWKTCTFRFWRLIPKGLDTTGIGRKRTPQEVKAPQRVPRLTLLCTTSGRPTLVQNLAAIQWQ